MPRPSLDQVRSVGDYTSLYRWNLELATPPAAIAAPPSIEDLNIRCESTELPRLTGETQVQNIRGHQVRSPGRYTYSESITLTFVETVDNVIHNFLRDWREAVWETNTGASNPRADVQAEILISRLDNQDNPIWQYKLIGAFLQDFDLGGTLDGTTSESLKPQLILAYQRFQDKSLIGG